MEPDTSLPQDIDAANAPAQGTGAFGPFNPPADYEFEPELQGEPPRRVPNYLRHGPHAARWKRNAAATFAAAIACVLLARVTAVRELGYYILPLAYLNWIGMGLAALSLGIMLLSAVLPGIYAYVRDGIAVVARVLACNTQIVVTKIEGGTVEKFKFVVDVEFTNPETGQLDRGQIFTAEIDSPRKAARYTLPFQPGDYVTLVYRPGQMDKSLRIYRLLGLNPDIPYIQKDGRTWISGLTASGAVLVTLGVVALMAILMGAFYALQFLAPLEASRRFIMAILPVGLVVGTVAAVLLYRAMRRESGQEGKRFKPALLALLAAVFFGGLGGFVTIAAINAGLDKSPPQFREVEVVELWQETSHGIFRDYKVEYRELAGGEKRKQPATVEQLNSFGPLRLGMLEVRAGRLGFPWVRQVHPLVLVPVKEDANVPGITLQMRNEKTGEVGHVKLGFVVHLGGEKYMPPTPALVERAKKVLSEEMGREREQATRPATRPE